MSVHRVSGRAARHQLGCLRARVEAGDEAVVMRRSAQEGKLVRPERKATRLPDLDALRASVKVSGQPLSREVIEGRRNARF